MDDDLVAIFQLVQIDKRARQTACHINVSCQNAVSAPGWEGGSLQPSSLTSQPGEVPRSILFRHPNDRKFDAQAWNFQGDIGRSIPHVLWLWHEFRHDIGSKTSRGQRRV